MEKEKNKLYIPVKFLDSDDYIMGFGKTELAITGISSIIFVVMGIVIYQFTQDTFRAVAVAVSLIICTVFLIRRDMYNENVFQKLRILRRNRKAQKHFKYYYTNIYEDIYCERK